MVEALGKLLYWLVGANPVVVGAFLAGKRSQIW
jgi:hypothetical protein